jgi:hypothetical protein
VPTMWRTLRQPLTGIASVLLAIFAVMTVFGATSPAAEAQSAVGLGDVKYHDVAAARSALPARVKPGRALHRPSLPVAAGASAPHPPFGWVGTGRQALADGVLVVFAAAELALALRRRRRRRRASAPARRRPAHARTREPGAIDRTDPSAATARGGGAGQPNRSYDGQRRQAASTTAAVQRTRVPARRSGVLAAPSANPPGTAQRRSAQAARAGGTATQTNDDGALGDDGLRALIEAAKRERATRHILPDADEKGAGAGTAQLRSPVRGGGDLTDELLSSGWWTDAMLRDACIPVVDVPFLTVGGGIGSFVTADYLRIAGVAPDRIRVLSNIDLPWQTYQYLTRVSQIPGRERIRSDSASRPDNIWGFPSYALREAVRERTLRPVWQVLVEPILADFYTPRARQVFAGLRREAKRIGYDQMLVKGQVGVVRRRHGGGYFTVLNLPADTAPAKLVVYRSEFVHLAPGYPGLKFLPDLQDFRIEHEDFHHVVSGYEDHEHVYDVARVKHVVVMLRGGGIAASRILQRLMDDRAQFGLSTEIVHLFRTYVSGSHGPNPWNRRKGGNGFAYQGFNYPKSVWGGQLKARMRKLEGDERASAYQVMGGANTPRRRRWQAQMKEGRVGGWYRTMSGTVEEMRLADGMVVSRVKTPDGLVNVAADFVIDCVGLEADIGEHPVLADVLAHSGAGRNPLGRLDVERNFQLRGADSGSGVIYASGAATLGGYFPGADTFLGLQIAAQEITDDLARRGFCRRIGPLRSSVQWLRWVFDRRP